LTAQYPDYLIIGSDTLRLLSNPLERFFSLHPNRRVQPNHINSANWRGYIAYFEIANSILTVKDVVLERYKDYTFSYQSVIDSVFRPKESRQARWYSGLLIVAHGDLLEYEHLDYASIYERYTLILVQRGRVVRQREMKSDEYLDFKARQFAEYQKTTEYKTYIFEQLKNDSTDTKEALDDFLFKFGGDYTTDIVLDF
jgi:hypothetical protein